MSGVFIRAKRRKPHFEAQSETVIVERCDFSDLYQDQCAHCLGIVADWEIKPKVTVYEGTP